MSRNKLVAIAATYALLTFSSVLNAVELKLLRYGPLGEEKPGLMTRRARFATYRRILLTLAQPLSPTQH